MKIYIDSDYKCHVFPAECLREIETDAFNGFCPEYIEGYRYIPEGEVWVNPNGVGCSGISPWKPYEILAKAQAEYEHQLLLEYEAAMAEIEIALGVTSE